MGERRVTHSSIRENFTVFTQERTDYAGVFHSGDYLDWVVSSCRSAVASNVGVLCERPIWFSLFSSFSLASG